MNARYDVIIVGSGFGGAVTACRLAENGYRVLVLERGRRWDVADYPSVSGANWIWDQYHPEKRNGWIDLRFFPHMTVVQGAGVGGGSLIYANVCVDAKPDIFYDGWPQEITLDELKPHYEAVGRMLDVQQVPAGQWTARTKLMQEAAGKIGYAGRFRPLELAVSFDESWSYGLPDPHKLEHSRKFTNAEGKEQGTCVHLGNCDIGCEAQARNTLDLNYIARAEKHGADIRPSHLVRSVVPEDGGYRVHYDRIENGRLTPGNDAARIVILAAGSLGSTELLLRSRDEHRTLPGVSSFLGRNWSSNGDFLTPAFHFGRTISPTRGPTITAAIDFLGQGNLDGHHMFIEDGGFPDMVSILFRLRRRPRLWMLSPGGAALLASLARLHYRRGLLPHLMPWFAQARDAADGTLHLRRRWLRGLVGKKKLFLKWDIRRSRATVNAVVEMHKRLARATGGKPHVPWTWRFARDLATPHPLGGCNMGSDPRWGVVDHTGEVYGYRNLYVADGSIVPEAMGLNPSKTIAALAERIAALIVAEGR